MSKKLTDEEFWFLEGYFQWIDDGDYPDGAWMQMHLDSADSLKEQYHKDDDHDFRGWDTDDLVMAYMSRKADQAEGKSGS